MAISKKTLITRILKRLGSNFIQVELNEDDIDGHISEAIDTAVEKYSKYFPNIERVTMNFYNEVNEYSLGTSATEIVSILDFIPDMNILYMPNVLLVPFADTFDLEEYTVSMARYELHRSVMQSKFMWELIKPRTLVLNPVPTYDFVGGVIYSTKSTIDDISSEGEEWVYDYSFAVSKEILGRVRGKYKSIETPGGTIDMGGSELVEEGRADQERLIEKIEARSKSMSLLWFDPMG